MNSGGTEVSVDVVLVSLFLILNSYFPSKNGAVNNYMLKAITLDALSKCIRIQ